MAIWRITGKGPEKVPETKLKEEKILEERLEDWVCADPALLGETLFVIGRQVIIPEVKDRLDVLALDAQGKAVIVELKRGKLKDPVDMQALRYASYIAKWGFQDFEKQARAYMGKDQDPDFNFNELYEEFCSQAGVDEVPDLNVDQRVLIVGSEVKDKLGSVALWLYDHNIDIKVIEIETFREGDGILIQPRVIVPLPVGRFKDVGRAPVGDVYQPWITDGKTWHLEKRCSPRTRDILLKFDEVIRSNLEVDGPRWDQKFYVAYRVGGYIWAYVGTHSKVLALNLLVKQGLFSQSELASRMKIDEFVEDESLSQKLALSSSVNVQKRSDSTDKVIVRIKEGFDLEAPEFISFLKEAYKGSAKQ